MSAVVAAGRRALPRGYTDFARQLLIWFGFYVVYQIARGYADRDVARAFENGREVIALERRVGMLWELSLQGVLTSSDALIRAASWTYWLSQFAVLGLALLWVYLRRNDHFLRFRNTVLLANLIGLAGYVALPTAPPRMFPEYGFVDTLNDFSNVGHDSTIAKIFINPYAAVPSMHCAFAMMIGGTGVMVCRHWWSKAWWAFWPLLVSWVTIVTANHYWVDAALGWLVALTAAGIAYRLALARPEAWSFRGSAAPREAEA